ncbi:hypothetical protein ACGFNX_08450 [Streptomyces sp. NPDC048723]
MVVAHGYVSSAVRVVRVVRVIRTVGVVPRGGAAAVGLFSLAGV